jgi:predicted LPLAT superfamily acyltransferase
MGQSGQTGRTAVTARDILQLGKILVFAAIAWCTPPRFWRKIAATTARIGQKDRCRPHYNAILAQRYSPAEIAIFGQRRRAYSRELKMQILGLSGPWKAWRPQIQLDGEINLRQGLEAGRGIILWVVESSFSTLIVKMALYGGGYHASQLSRPGHGFNLSFSFGARYVNPIWVSVEDQFIAERVLITDDTAAETLAVLRSRLSANGIVIITLAPLAHKFVDAPFFGGQIQLPTGPIRLAATTGAVLLPVFAWTEHEDRFVVSIEEPVNPAAKVSEIADIAAAYAKRLEPFVLAHPDQWSGWDWLGYRMRSP